MNEKLQPVISLWFVAQRSMDGGSRKMFTESKSEQGAVHMSAKKR